MRVTDTPDEERRRARARHDRAKNAATARWNQQAYVTRTCQREGCDNTYETPASAKSRYCSTICWRKVRDAGHAYDDLVACPICGIEFWQSRSKRTPQTCSPEHGHRLRRLRKLEADAAKAWAGGERRLARVTPTPAEANPQQSETTKE